MRAGFKVLVLGLMLIFGCDNLGSIESKIEGHWTSMDGNNKLSFYSDHTGHVEFAQAGHYLPKENNGKWLIINDKKIASPVAAIDLGGGVVLTFNINLKDNEMSLLDPNTFEAIAITSTRPRSFVFVKNK